MTTYYSLMTTAGIEYINTKVLVDSEKIFADGWYIKLGNGDVSPNAQSIDLVNVIYDKTAEDYPQITFGRNPDGHYAEMLLPESLKGQVITEAGLFNEEDILIAVAKTHIDLSNSGDGLEMSVKQRIYLSAVPSTITVIYTAQADLITEDFLNDTLEEFYQFWLRLLKSAYIPDITNGEIYFTIVEDLSNNEEVVALISELRNQIPTKLSELENDIEAATIGEIDDKFNEIIQSANLSDLQN